MPAKSANKMWGGRFKVSPSEVMEDINASVAYDQRFASQDIAGSVAHAEMLADCGIITAADAKRIVKGLGQVAREIEAGDFEWSRALEDVHMNVESRLTEVVGPAAGRLHTARSRNDQVATDFRLYIRDRIDAFDQA
ncbi:MAG: lyase family protein, partial [Pseudomonadota bacterium]